MVGARELVRDVLKITDARPVKDRGIHFAHSFWQQHRSYTFQVMHPVLTVYVVKISPGFRNIIWLNGSNLSIFCCLVLFVITEFCLIFLNFYPALCICIKKCNITKVCFFLCVS